MVQCNCLFIFRLKALLEKEKVDHEELLSQQKKEHLAEVNVSRNVQLNCFWREFCLVWVVTYFVEQASCGWLIITMKNNKAIEIVFLKNESNTMHT